MKKFRQLRFVVMMLLAFALAGMASAQLSLSFPAYSEEKTSFEVPANFQMIMYVGDESGSQGSYNAANGNEPSIIRGGWLDVMLVNFNVALIDIEMRFVHPALQADQKELERMSKEDQGWVSGKKSDTAYTFRFDTRDLPPLHSVAVLRMKTKTRTRHSAPILSFIRWVSTSTQRSDQGFALMVQDLPPSAGHIPMSDLMQMGLFRGFQSRWATLPQDPMRVINQGIPGQSSTAGSQQSQGNSVLPPDLDLPGSNNTNNLLASQGGSGLPPDLPLETQKLPDFSVRFSNERLGRAVGALADGELAEAMRTPHSGNTVAVRNAQATIYIWSDEFFEGEIRSGNNKVPLAVFRASNGKYWARLCGATSALPDSKLVVKAGLNTRTINFTPEVN